MTQISGEKLISFMQEQAAHITFLTGAGVSTPSGIPDYRSLTGVYHGLEEPEYLLSATCLKYEPEKFYAFVKHLYHPDAKPNIIHEKIAEYCRQGSALVTQNIDGLHQRAATPQMVAFHGNLSDVYCQKCQAAVPVADYLTSDVHANCGGRLRPNIILYEEGLPLQRIIAAEKMVAQAQLLVVVGTSLKVYPFAGLLDAKKPDSQVVVINREAPSRPLAADVLEYYGSAEEIFKEL